MRFLSFGTLEPRKNQVEAMRAFSRLRARRPDLDMRFDLVGNVHGGVAAAVQEIAAREPRIRLHRYLPDDELRALVQASHVTVFVSQAEGYGLPVAESLWLGRPCLCSDHGSVAEIAAGGGCLAVSAADPAAIESGFERLASDPELRARLAAEARARPLRRWGDYADGLLAELAAAPLLPHAVLIEGSAGAADPAPLEVSGATVRRLHWRPASRALLPGAARAPEQPAPGDGRLGGLHAVLPATTCADAAEAAAIAGAARGLGLRVALEAPPAPLDPAWLATLAAADLALFADAAARDATLAAALRELPRTATLRERFRVGTGASAPSAIASDLPRTAAAGPPEPVRRVFYWVGLTVTQPFNTGVQRVTRRLAAALERRGVEVVPVRWDAAARRIAPISDADAEALARFDGPPVRPRPPLPERLAGEWLLLPEIALGDSAPEGGPLGFARGLGMRTAAVFYDLIPEKMPENYPAVALEALHVYWSDFASADLALPISWSVAADLARWLSGRSLHLPAILPCPLAGDVGGPRATEPPAVPVGEEALRLIAVGTWEPRKNYPRLLRALLAAQRRSARRIELVLIGRRAGFTELDAEIERLAAATGTELLDHAEEAELHRRQRNAHAAVFASWEEGFGLPVLESLWHGRPCLCHHGSAMAEVAPGGGTLLVDMLDEDALAAALLRLAGEPGLLARLGAEAVARPIRSWDDYAEDVLLALSRAGAAPGWPLPDVLPAPAIGERRPLLSCAITTYNRAPWLSHSLPLLLEATRPWRDVVEVVVCDNTSTDATPEVVARFRDEAHLSAHRNPANVGMLGNLGATARHARGAFVWLLGDDDLLVDGAIENVLEGLAAHPEVEMAYMNYAYTTFDRPELLMDAAEIIEAATPIAPGGPNRRVPALREVSPLNENLFTAIYACAFRRDHAIRGYGLDTRGAPFSSLLTCVPSSVYALAALQDRPAWWVGEPALVVNMNVSWTRWVLLWHLERMPDLFDAAERAGVVPAALDRYRAAHAAEAERWLRECYFEAEDTVRRNVSAARLLERCKHLPVFREQLAGVRRAYADAWAAGRVLADGAPPAELFARYGLEG